MKNECSYSISKFSNILFLNFPSSVKIEINLDYTDGTDPVTLVSSVQFGRCELSFRNLASHRWGISTVSVVA